MMSIFSTSTASSQRCNGIYQIAITGLGLLILFVLLYISSYLLVRARHDLLMTGQFHNAHKADGSLAPEAGWRNVQIMAQSPRTAWMEGAYAPLIWLEARLQVVLAGEP